MKFSIFLVLIPLIGAEYVSDSACPVRPIYQDFDIKKIAGRWYTVMQYTDNYAISMTCSYGEYTLKTDSSMDVKDCELVDGNYKCLNGVGSIEKPENGPIMAVISFALAHEPTKKIDEFTYLTIDYDKYAIVYECVDKPDGKSVHSMWVASRTPIMSESVKQEVDEILEKYFDKNSIKHVEQSESVCGSRE